MQTLNMQQLSTLTFEVTTMKVRFFFTLLPVIANCELITMYFGYYYLRVENNLPHYPLYLIEHKQLGWIRHYLADLTGELITNLGFILFSKEWMWLERGTLFDKKQFISYMDTLQLTSGEDFISYCNYVAMSL